MSARSLDALLNPESIAILGASSDPLRIGGKPVRFLRERGYAGRVYPVNPNRSEIQGWRSYPSIEQLPEVPELVVLAVATERILPTLEQCAALGVKAALIFTAGFAETGQAGREAQTRIGEIAARSGMRILGPNCIGLVNLHRGVAPTFSSSFEDRPITLGEVAFVTQSGAFGSFFFSTAQEAGLGFSAWINTGNEADVELAECLEYFVDHPETRVITAWAEGFRDVDRLRRAAEAARSAGKPLLLCKAGRSATGARAAASHTAALATDDRVVDGLCRQHGIVRVDDLQELEDGARACLSRHLPAGPGVGVITVSGGAGVMMADECSRRGLRIGQLGPASIARLRELLPWYASASNPVDATAQLMNDPGCFRAALETLAADPAIDSLVVFMGLQANIAERVATDTVAVSRAIDKPIFVTWMLTPPVAREIVEAGGLPLYQDPTRCIAGLAALVRHAAARRRPPRPLAPTTENSEPPAELTKLRDALAMGQEVRWSEPRTKRLLGAYGLETTREELVGTAEEAVAAAERIGFPLVVKLAAANLVHKAEVGGVRIGLRTVDEVRDAAVALLRLSERAPDWGCEGLLVQEQLMGGLELLLGVRTDPIFGPIVSLGPGGSLAEALDDVSVRLPPLVPGDIGEMLAELRLRTLFTTFLNGVSPGRVSLERAVMALSQLSADLSRVGAVIELDINPAFVGADGRDLTVADAALLARPRQL